MNNEPKDIDKYFPEHLVPDSPTDVQPDSVRHGEDAQDDNDGLGHTGWTRSDDEVEESEADRQEGPAGIIIIDTDPPPVDPIPELEICLHVRHYDANGSIHLHSHTFTLTELTSRITPDHHRGHINIAVRDRTELEHSPNSFPPSGIHFSLP